MGWSKYKTSRGTVDVHAKLFLLLHSTLKYKNSTWDFPMVQIQREYGDEQVAAGRDG